ncbi:hypothetical protein NC651_039171 [Populus alba x Populus x berolinensis]|nr:hypothetical protein NC651_039171 [Populus alba x Populus x berolinensis]
MILACKIWRAYKKCVVSGCNAIKILAEGKELEEDIFPSLEDLRLYDLPRLSNIVEGHVSPRSLANLNNCKNLEDFFEENATATEKVNYELPSLKFFPLKCLRKIVSIDTIVKENGGMKNYNGRISQSSNNFSLFSKYVLMLNLFLSETSKIGIWGNKDRNLFMFSLSSVLLPFVFGCRE